MSAKAALLAETGHPNAYTLTKCLAEHELASDEIKTLDEVADEMDDGPPDDPAPASAPDADADSD